MGDGVIVGIILIVIIWAAYTFVVPHASTTTTTSPQPSGAPDFTLPIVDQFGLTGQSISLSSFHGKVILLEFMVPWCPHCQKMAPVLGKLYQQFGQNVIFLSVSGAWNGATADDAAQFIRAYSVTWTLVYDSSKSAFTMYGVNQTPTFFLIDKNGRITVSYPGEVAYDTLSADLARLTA
ncbi:MAG: TlpA disulfide reductase family protein [Candidatus Bathyarchaeia archaeon]